MGNTYQYIQRPVLLLEGLSKLPNLTRFLHVDDMDVHLLITSRWNPGPLSQVIIVSILKPLTVFPDSLTITSLAASALSLFLHTMWTVPPGNTHTQVRHHHQRGVLSRGQTSAYLSGPRPWRSPCRFRCWLQ